MTTVAPVVWGKKELFEWSAVISSYSSYFTLSLLISLLIISGYQPYLHDLFIRQLISSFLYNSYFSLSPLIRTARFFFYYFEKFSLRIRLPLSRLMYDIPICFNSCSLSFHSISFFKEQPTPLIYIDRNWREIDCICRTFKIPSGLFKRNEVALGKPNSICSALVLFVFHPNLL